MRPLATRAAPRPAPPLPQPSTSRAAVENAAPIRRSGRIRKSKQPGYEPIPTKSRGSGGRGRAALLPKGPKLSLPAPTQMEVVPAERELKAPVGKRKLTKGKEANNVAEKKRRDDQTINYEKLLKLFNVMVLKTASLPKDHELYLPVPTPKQASSAQREKKARKPKMSAKERNERNKIGEKKRRTIIQKGIRPCRSLME